MVSHLVKQEEIYIHTDNQGDSPTLSEAEFYEEVVQHRQEGAAMSVVGAIRHMTSPITTLRSHNHGEGRMLRRP